MAVAFDKYANRGGYHWSESNPLRLRYNAPLVSRYRSVLSRIPREAGLILDFGCGDGYLAYLLAKQRPQAAVWGVDSEPEAIKIAALTALKKGNGKLQFVHSTDDVLPFGDSTFDTVVMADVIEHLPNPKAVLGDLCRVLEPGGVLIVTTPNRQKDFRWDVRHVKEYSGPELRAEIGTYFSDVSVYGSWPMRHMYSWRRKRMGRIILDLTSRVASNKFDTETSDPDESFGQLIAVARKV